MPVKASKKTISQKKRREIHDAAASIPGLIIEHVAFGKNSSARDSGNNDRPNKRYMLSDEKRREHQKKRTTVAIGVGSVVLILAILWVVNIKTFFFDSKHSISVEETILKAVKNDFKSTVGTISEDKPTIASSTENILQTASLQAALIAGLEASSTSSPATSSTTSSTPSVSPTTTTEVHFPVAQDSTTTPTN